MSAFTVLPADQSVEISMGVCARCLKGRLLVVEVHWNYSETQDPKRTFRYCRECAEGK